MVLADVRREMSNVPLFPGVAEGLDALGRSGLRMPVLSSHSREGWGTRGGPYGTSRSGCWARRDGQVVGGVTPTIRGVTPMTQTFPIIWNLCPVV